MATWRLMDRVTDEDRSSPLNVVEVYEDGHGSTSLPAMNAVNSVYSNAYVSHINKTYFPGKQNQIATITYTPFSNENPDPSSSFSALPRRWRVNGEMISVKAGNALYYKSTTETAEQNLYKRILNETYVVTEVVSDMSLASSNGPHGKILRHAGRVNKTSWEGFGKGNWLYLGADVDEQFSATGSQTFKIEHQFQARLIPSSSEGWQRIFNDAAGSWDQVSDSPGFNENGQLYTFTNFSNIFTAAGA